MNLLLFADQSVGSEIFHWLLTRYREDLALVITTSANEIYAAAMTENISCTVYESPEQVTLLANNLTIPLELGILAWWPTILKPPLLELPKHGFINTHPSYLPYNRGKHYNFWALVEQAPFGTSLHFVDSGVDTGDIVAQKLIPYDWEDTGGTLYEKARNATIELFKEQYPALRLLQFTRERQDLMSGSTHKSHELEKASQIDLQRSYRAVDLLNLLRARTFPDHPACWFTDNGHTYEVRIEIKRIQK